MQGASSSGIPPWGAREAEKTTRGRHSNVVRNLTLLIIEATSLGASGSDIPPQRTTCSSIPED
jgi:hypothetical protein